MRRDKFNFQIFVLKNASLKFGYREKLSPLFNSCVKSTAESEHQPHFKLYRLVFEISVDEVGFRWNGNCLIANISRSIWRIWAHLIPNHMDVVILFTKTLATSRGNISMRFFYWVWTSYDPWWSIYSVFWLAALFHFIRIFVCRLIWFMTRRKICIHFFNCAFSLDLDINLFHDIIFVISENGDNLKKNEITPFSQILNYLRFFLRR